MGIYDRDYVRNDRRRSDPRMAPSAGRPARAGVFGLFSVNMWIIIVNVAVFILGASLTRSGVPVAIFEELPAGVSQWREPTGYFMPQAQNQPLRGMATSRGQLVEALPEIRRRVGVFLVRPLFDETTNEPIGQRVYRVMDPLTAYGHFSTAKGFLGVEVWRLVTFQFLHDGIAHLFFNMFGLIIFGGMVEQQLGRRRYLAFYLVCGIFGGLMYLVLNLLGSVAGLSLPAVLINDIHTPLVGASAGVFGVIMACAAIAPNTIVQLIFPPIPLKLKYMAYGYVILALVNLLAQGNNAGGDAAHIGGALAGWFFIRNSYLLRDFFDVLGDSRASAKPSKRADRDRGEVDRILAKVQRSGMDSLSAAEKRRLSRASRENQ